jgi:hypothetical protein
VTGLDQRHQLHVHRHRDQRWRHRCAASVVSSPVTIDTTPPTVVSIVRLLPSTAQITTNSGATLRDILESGQSIAFTTGTLLLPLLIGGLISLYRATFRLLW